MLFCMSVHEYMGGESAKINGHPCHLQIMLSTKNNNRKQALIFYKNCSIKTKKLEFQTL